MEKLFWCPCIVSTVKKTYLMTLVKRFLVNVANFGFGTITTERTERVTTRGKKSMKLHKIIRFSELVQSNAGTWKWLRKTTRVPHPGTSNSLSVTPKNGKCRVAVETTGQSNQHPVLSHPHSCYTCRKVKNIINMFITCLWQFITV